MDVVMSIAAFAAAALRAAGHIISEPEFFSAEDGRAPVALSMGGGERAMADCIGELRDAGRRIGRVYQVSDGAHYVVDEAGKAHRI